ncbi:cytochrome P450 [Allokutzneria sp. A3M-2-11 16]|uniref:cytochrome P450 n=1 Tax=Allokutzneria sp. A3M-2-11 16 TaxID=2962043 RepID=UPI0020B6CE85|nr:cytochrome P450 [Allokutzneria sp. A3M-2-11 16]MCP3803273.1 cytochrome P450 [Allokutzneria sp. A3M-2-11 16]
MAECEPVPYPFPRAELTAPAPAYRRLRRERPVCRVRLPSGDLAWLVSRCADARLVLADPRFSKRALLDGGAARTRRGELLAGLLFTTDPPEHTELRARLTGALTPRRVAALRPVVVGLAERLLDDLEPGGDLMPAFVEPLAMSVICALLGVSVDEHRRYARWAETVLSVDHFSDDEVSRAQRELLENIHAQVRAASGPGLIAALAADSPDSPDVLAVVKLVATLLVTGYETMVAAIGCSVLTLLLHCGQIPAADPLLLEELLRFVTFGDALRSRRAVADVELGGVLIRSGDVVMVSIASANRDEDAFAEPERFDPRRRGTRHLSFGHGPHFCVGAALARLELEVALEVLARRLPALRLAAPAEEIRLRHGSAEAPPESLPVTW